MAEDLLLTRGFNAFSYQHISSELGMKNAAIHYHYPKRPGRGGDPALSPAFSALCRWPGRPIGPRPAGSVFSAVHPLLPAQPANLPQRRAQRRVSCAAVRHAGRSPAFVAEMRDWATRILQHGLASGEFHFAGDARAMAAVMFAALQGGLQLAGWTPPS